MKKQIMYQGTILEVPEHLTPSQAKAYIYALGHTIKSKDSWQNHLDFMDSVVDDAIKTCTRQCKEDNSN